MGLSKSQSILILLGVDAVFFLLEITVGYAVHSLALVADSFHMLNDVLSLLVGLWAVKVAQQKERSNMYTYGWQRAETVGALVNGVFLVALCLSIVLDAIQRFVEPQEVSSPKLVLIVGCFGLASNILGLLLFHEHGHGHSHGSEGHSHSHRASDAHSAAEEGHGHFDEELDLESQSVADETGKAIDVLPETRITNGVPSHSPTQIRSPAREISWDVTPVSPSRQDSTKSRSPKWTRNRRHSRSRSRTYSTIDEIYVHPASFRNEIIAAAREDNLESPTDTETDETPSEPPTEETPMLKRKQPKASDDRGRRKLGKKPTKSNEWHKNHKHSEPQESSHGHSHADLNMRGVFLHVLGDALGNIGVITSALFIWLTDYSWRFYADPVISLIITVIILTTAIPLCKAASRILLQAVPAGISIDDLKNDIEELPGIISAHHIHVWQLSDTKFVASLHVQVEFDFKGEGSARYMQLARAIRGCLHEYGIHSSTIQPEFCVESAVVNPEYSSCDEDGAPKNGKPKVHGSKKSSKASSLVGSGSACLLECGDECGDSKQCCAPGTSTGRGDDN